MKRPKSKVIYSILGAVILLFILLIVLQIYTQKHGGYSLDPTDSDNYYHVVIKNNLHQNVQVSWVNDCLGNDPRCNKSWTIKPNQAVLDQASRGDPILYRVYGNNKLLGCLSINKAQSQTHNDTILLTANHQSCST